MLKIGDTVKVRPILVSDGKPCIHAGKVVVIQRMHKDVNYLLLGHLYQVSGIDGDFYEGSLELISKGDKSMLKQVGSDLKEFVVEHKHTIYLVAVLLLMDQVFFAGAFRERLNSLMNKLLGKVECALDGKKV